MDFRPSLNRRMPGRTSNSVAPRRSLALALAIASAVTALYMALPLGGNAKTAAQLQQEIAQKRAKEGVLSSDIQRLGSRISKLEGRISKLQRRQNSIQADLDRKEARHRTVATELQRTRDRLARLRKRLAHGKKVLSARLVAVYKAGTPDILTVALESDGFGDMIERATYLKELARQDRRVISTVTRLRGETKRETVKLASLEREAAQLVAQVRSRRNEVASAKSQLASRQGDLASVRSSRKSTLATVSRSRRHLEEDLAAMQASSQQVQGMLGGTGAPPKAGSGRLRMPMNGTFTSPFGMRWGRLHAGIDIAAPVGTGIYAADGGTVRYAGSMSGYGNYTCIQHTAALSTCYAHQSSIGVSVGQHVRSGQHIGACGNTGHSTGPHLHFEVRVNGSPVDPMGYL